MKRSTNPPNKRRSRDSAGNAVAAIEILMLSGELLRCRCGASYWAKLVLGFPKNP